MLGAAILIYRAMEICMQKGNSTHNSRTAPLFGVKPPRSSRPHCKLISDTKTLGIATAATLQFSAKFLGVRNPYLRP